MRRLLIAVLITLTALGAAAPAFAQSTGSQPDNAAVAVNTKDGTDLFKLAFSLYRFVNANQPQPGNAAAAVSSCTDCATTAIAIQIVLLMAPVSSPTNVAIAENVGCDSCTTIALAYQLLFDVNSKVRLSPDGRKEIKDLLDQIAALQNQNLTPDELRSKTDALVSQLANVISNELVPIGQGENNNAATATPSATAPETPPASTEPATTTAAPTESPIASPSPSTSPEATPVATP
jgi:putative peptide zinc metalloprotease protein